MRDAEDHAARVVAGHSLAVDPHFDHLVHRIDAGDDLGPHRLEGIAVLGAPERAIAALPAALADVVAQCVARYAIQSFCF
jgi:hypothetical protein